MHAQRVQVLSHHEHACAVADVQWVAMDDARQSAPGGRRSARRASPSCGPRAPVACPVRPDAQRRRARFRRTPPSRAQSFLSGDSRAVRFGVHGRGNMPGSAGRRKIDHPGTNRSRPARHARRSSAARSRLRPPPDRVENPSVTGFSGFRRSAVPRSRHCGIRSALSRLRLRGELARRLPSERGQKQRIRRYHEDGCLCDP